MRTLEDRMVAQLMLRKRLRRRLVRLLPLALLAVFLVVPPACQAQDNWRAQAPEWTMTVNKALDRERRNIRRAWAERQEKRREYMRETDYSDHDRRDWNSQREERWRDSRLSKREQDFVEDGDWPTLRERTREGYDCRGKYTVGVLSPESPSARTALEDGISTWSATVQHMHGGRFMEISASASFVYHCGMSNAHDSGTNKAQIERQKAASWVPFTASRKASKEGEPLGFKRCWVEAYACSAPLRSIGTAKEHLRKPLEPDVDSDRRRRNN